MAIEGALAQIGQIPRHCETFLPNNDCRYLGYGCLACTNLNHIETRIKLEREQIARKIIGLPPESDQIDYKATLARLTREEWLKQESERYLRRDAVYDLLRVYRALHH